MTARTDPPTSGDDLDDAEVSLDDTLLEPDADEDLFDDDGPEDDEDDADEDDTDQDDADEDDTDQDDPAPDDPALGVGEDDDEDSAIAAVATAAAAFDDDVEEEEDLSVVVSEELVEDELEGVRDGEFVCRGCYMAKRETQLSDPEQMLCIDCV